MKTLTVVLTLAFALCLVSCEKITMDGETFMAHDVSVCMYSDQTMAETIEFINQFNFDVDEIRSMSYVSDLPADSLKYVRNYLNQLDFLTNGDWTNLGYIYSETNQICILPTMTNMHQSKNQEEWLKCMEVLKLKELDNGGTGGCVIRFQVPRRKEKYWEQKFQEYDCVKWAELNYYFEIEMM